MMLNDDRVWRSTLGQRMVVMIAYGGQCGGLEATYGAQHGSVWWAERAYAGDLRRDRSSLLRPPPPRERPHRCH
eukprot:1251375-Rhodomonas_salina.1